MDCKAYSADAGDSLDLRVHLTTAQMDSVDLEVSLSSLSPNWLFASLSLD
jgi:hypothetical protein